MEEKALFDEAVTHEKIEAYRTYQHDELSLKTSGTFAEMVEEVERVSRQLRDTKLLLTRTRTELEGSHERERDLQAQIKLRDERINQLHDEHDDLYDKVATQDSDQNRIQHDNRQLRATLEQKDKELKQLRDENCRLLDEGQKIRDEKQELTKELAAKEAGMARPTLESRLRRAVELLKKDVERSKDKFQKSQDELFSKRRSVEKLESANAKLSQSVEKYERQVAEKDESLKSYQRRLRQATEETATLIEEVASVRDELNRTKKVAEGHESIMRREITDKVSEKIKLQVRETVTEQVTKKVTREVTAAMKAEREKEINTLREKFKQLFKENSVLKQQIESSTNQVDYAKKLEDQVPALSDEITRLRALLEETKKEHEISTGELESHFRRKIQAIKEEAAREKWTHAAEVRRQISKERDREVTEFTSRMESLSKQTDKLLNRADKEKEEYAEEVKKRVSMEKQNEINALAQKLERRTKESDTLIQEAARDKEVYANLVRQQVQEESQREVNKYIYRLEVMAAERDNLVKRIQHFEQELNWTWKENESNSDQLKTSLSDLKATEDEAFKLRRKNQNLSTLVDRYKQDYEEISKELQQTKHEFQAGVVTWEEQKAKLKDKLARREAAIEQSGHEFSEALRDLENAKQALHDTNRAYEVDMVRMKEQYESLQHSRNLNRNVEDYTSAVEAENFNLKARIRELELLLDGQHKRSAELEKEILMLREERENVQSSVSNLTVGGDGRKYEESLWALEAENAQLKANTDDLDALVEHYKQVARSADLEISKLKKENEGLNESIEKVRAENKDDSKPLAEMKEENERLKVNNKELTSYLAFYKAEKSKQSAESIRERSDFEQSLKASQQEIEEIKQQLKDTNALLDQYRADHAATTEDLEKSKQIAEDALTHASEEDTVQLNMEIQTLEKLLDRYKAAKAELLSDEDVSGLDLKRALMFSEKEIMRLKDEIGDLRVALNQRRSEQYANDPSIFEAKMSNLQQEIDELKSSLSQSHTDCLEAIEKLAHSKNENQNLNGKITDLNDLLERYRDELSKTSEELENSKQLLVTESEAATRLQQRVESLNLLLDTTEQNHIENSKAFKESKQMFDEANTAYEEEIFHLKGEIGNLKRLQEKTQKKHLAETEQAAQHGLELEAGLRAATKAAKMGEERVAFLEGELEKCRVQFSDVSEELMHSKRMFKEALMKTERSKHEIQQKMKDLKVELDKSQRDKETISKDLEESHLELEQALVVTAARARDKVKDMESLLNKANGDNVKLSKQLHKSEKKLKVSMEVWADEKSSLRHSIDNLKGLLDTSRKENAKITKDLQHSMNLFKEALAAWREETQSLNEELYVLKQSSQHNHDNEDNDDDNQVDASTDKDHTEHSSVIESFSNRLDSGQGVGRDPPAVHATLGAQQAPSQRIDRSRSRSSRDSYGESEMTEESEISHSDGRLETTSNTIKRSSVPGADDTESSHVTMMSAEEAPGWHSDGGGEVPANPRHPPGDSQSSHRGSRRSDSSGGTGSLEESDKVDVDGSLVSTKQIGDSISGEQNSLTTSSVRANSSSAASQSGASSMVSRPGINALTAEKKKRVTWKEEATGYEVSASPSDLSSDNMNDAPAAHSSDIPSEVTGIVRTKQNDPSTGNGSTTTAPLAQVEPKTKKIVASSNNRPSTTGTSVNNRRKGRRKQGDGGTDSKTSRGNASTTAESRQDSHEGDGTVSVENEIQRVSAPPPQREEYVDNDDASVDSTDEIIRASLRNNMQTWNKALEEFSEILREGHSNRSNRSIAVENDHPVKTSSARKTKPSSAESEREPAKGDEDESKEGSDSSRKKTVRWSKTFHEQTYEENDIVSTSGGEHKTFTQINDGHSVPQEQRKQSASVAKKKKKKSPIDLPKSVVVSRPERNQAPVVVAKARVGQIQPRNESRDPVSVYSTNSLSSNGGDVRDDTAISVVAPPTFGPSNAPPGPSDADSQFSWSVSSRADEDGPTSKQPPAASAYSNARIGSTPAMDDTDDESTLNWQLLGDYSERSGYSSRNGRILLEQRTATSSSQGEETAASIESSKHSRLQGEYGNNSSTQSIHDERSANQLASSIATPTTTTTSEGYATSRQSEGDITVAGELSSTTPKSSNNETVGDSTAATDATLPGDNFRSTAATESQKNKRRNGTESSDNMYYGENRDNYPAGADDVYHENDHVDVAASFPRQTRVGAPSEGGEAENNISAHSSSSYTTSSYSSTLSYSMHDSSTSTHLSRTLDLTSDKALLNRAADNVLKKFRQKRTSKNERKGTDETTNDGNKEGDTKTATSKESSSKSSRKTGFQRSLEKASRRLWSQSDLHRFMKKKSRRKRSSSRAAAASPGGSMEDEPYDERHGRAVDSTSGAGDDDENVDEYQIKNEHEAAGGGGGGGTDATAMAVASDEVSATVSNSSVTTNHYDNRGAEGSTVTVKESTE